MPTGHPGPTPRRPPHHTHPPHQLCDCVCQCACALACLPAVAQLCLNATAECQSSRVVPVTHTAGWRYCVGAVSTLSATVATSCLCIPRTQKTHRGFPPARTRPATSASPSLRPPVCALLYLFIHTLPGFDQLLVTNRGVRHCNQPEERRLVISLCGVRHPEIH